MAYASSGEARAVGRRSPTAVASPGLRRAGHRDRGRRPLPFARLDNAVDAWLRETSGSATGLHSSPAIAALVFAYLVRFLAVSLNTVEASLAKIRPSTMDDAARSLGKGPVGTTLFGSTRRSCGAAC